MLIAAAARTAAHSTEAGGAVAFSRATELPQAAAHYGCWLLVPPCVASRRIAHPAGPLGALDVTANAIYLSVYRSVPALGPIAQQIGRKIAKHGALHSRLCQGYASVPPAMPCGATVVARPRCYY